MPLTTTITPDVVIGIKSDFKQFSNDYISRTIKSGTVRALGDGLDQPLNTTDQDTIQQIFDDAVLAYSRHLLMVDIFAQYNGVTQASTMQNSQTITDKTKNDPYLAEYNRISALYGSSTLQRGTVTFYAD